MKENPGRVLPPSFKLCTARQVQEYEQASVSDATCGNSSALQSPQGLGWASSRHASPLIPPPRPAPPRPAPPSFAPPPVLLRRRKEGVPGLEGRGVAGGWAWPARASRLVRWRRWERSVAVWRDAGVPVRSPAALSARAALGHHGGGLRAHPPLGGRGRGAGAAAASRRLGPAAEGRARERREAAGGRGRGCPPRARHRRAAGGVRGRVDLRELVHRAGPDPQYGLRCDPCARATRPSLPQFPLTFPPCGRRMGTTKISLCRLPKRISPSGEPNTKGNFIQDCDVSCLFKFGLKF